MAELEPWTWQWHECPVCGFRIELDVARGGKPTTGRWLCQDGHEGAVMVPVNDGQA